VDAARNRRQLVENQLSRDRIGSALTLRSANSYCQPARRLSSVDPLGFVSPPMAVSGAGLIGVVPVEWRGYSYPARSVLGSDDLVGVVFEADPRAVGVEVL